MRSAGRGVVTFDTGEHLWDLETVKAPGTVTVEKHRPLKNRLSAAERRQLRQRAAEMFHGGEALASGR